MTEPSPEIRDYFRKLGQKTLGKKCPARARGDDQYYREMARKRWDKAKAKLQPKKK